MSMTLLNVYRITADRVGIVALQYTNVSAVSDAEAITKYTADYPTDTIQSVTLVNTVYN